MNSPQHKSKAVGGSVGTMKEVIAMLKRTKEDDNKEPRHLYEMNIY